MMMRVLSVSDKLRSKAPGFLWRTISVGWLNHQQEPQSEELPARNLQAGTRPGLVPLLTLTNALGLLIVSISYYLSVAKYSYLVVEICFLSGLLLMFVPNFARLLSPTLARLERICLLCLLGEFLFFVSFLCSPLHFSQFDETLHWRTAYDILKTGHLFSVNSMLPVSAYYPGLELLTNAISTTTGLSFFLTGNIIIMASRLLMIVSLYLLCEYIYNSDQLASIALLLYITNPHFIFFDATYSYETIALPFALFMLYIIVRYANADKNHRWMIVTVWIVLAALTITHHMTDYFFVGLLLLWAGISLFRPVSRKSRLYLIAIALSGVLLAGTYAFLFPGNSVWNYLSQYFGSAFSQLGQVITGGDAPRQIFTESVSPIPLWDRLFISGAVILVVLSLPLGLLSLWRFHRNEALLVTFGIIALIYPFTYAFRFTRFGTEIPERASAFLFLPIASLLTILLAHFWLTHGLDRRVSVLICSAVLVIFLGNVIHATGPSLTLLPGPYMVVADARSIEPEGIDAAKWSFIYLGSNNRIATDRINQMLMNTYGHQRIVTYANDQVDIAPLFYSEQFDSVDNAILQQGRIHYVIVDTRLSTALPLENTYFENDMPHRIIRANALEKFAAAHINRLFDSGNIIIYGTGALIHESTP